VKQVNIGPAHSHSFPERAAELLSDSQLRRNVRHATDVISVKRRKVVAELPEWQSLRKSGSEIRQHVLNHLDEYLVQFERNCRNAGGQVHWAKDAEEARQIIHQLVLANGSREILKVKSMTTEEIGLNRFLQAEGFQVYETDLAELILQLGAEEPSHLVVPALHKNREQVRQIFADKMNLPGIGDSPEDLTSAARAFLREKFLRVPVAISGANFLIAENGAVCIVESEGNGRMCLTLPRLLITLAGIEKVIPSFRDLEVFLQTLPRSATGERMNPYNSIWTGVHSGDGPSAFHVVLLDNGRSRILRDRVARQTLRCIRCGACQNACPVYRETGGHAYSSVYAGPIGAILTPQLRGFQQASTLPYASSLCGACYEVCPVSIDIPEVLLHLRSGIVREQQKTLSGQLGVWNVGMKLASFAMRSPWRFLLALRVARVLQRWFLGRSGYIERLPFFLSGWTATRDLVPLAHQSFREWWAEHETGRQRP